MKSITLGRYAPYNSFVHRLDPRAKVFGLILLMVAVFMSYSTPQITFIVAGVLAAFILFIALVSHVSIKSLFGSLKTMWFIIIFLLILNCLIPPKDAQNVLFSIGTLPVYLESILQSLKIIIRLVLMLLLTMILTATTEPLDLTFALEWYMTPLKLIKFPAHEVAMTISIALRFIPTLLTETERIMKAQSSRGVDFKHGKLSARFKAIVSLIIPLFVSAFQRSEELADSMEARGYNPSARRTRYHVQKFNLYDLFITLLLCIFLAGTICVSTLKITVETPLFYVFLLVFGGFVVIYLAVISIVNRWSFKK